MKRQDQVLRVAGLMAGILFAGAPLCRAQATTPADPAPETRPAVPAPANNWWDNAQAGPRPAMPAPAPRNDDRGGPFHRDERSSTGGQGSGSGVMDYPSSDMSDWVMANTMAARTRMLFSRAQSDLSAAIRHFQNRAEKSRDFQDALAAERQAYAEYDEDRKQALRTLADNDKYQAILSLRDELGAKLARRRADKDASKDEIVAMATLKMNYASDARAMEVEALSADPTLKPAHDRMVAASQRVSQMRAQLEDALHEAPEVVAARHNLENARIAMVEASAYAYASAVAGSTALNYSYYLHRNDVDSVYGPYGPGYASPYWAR
jgi:hypothetical protein